MNKKSKLAEYKIFVQYILNRRFPIDYNKAVFCNYNGKGFGCNPKYIALELHKRHPDFDIVWVVSDKNVSVPDWVRTVLWDSSEAIYELSTAGVWVDNQRKLYYHRKRKNQFFIATWHGAGIPMKKIGADNPNNLKNKPYMHTSKHMNRITDIMISNSVSCSEIFHRAFLYDKTIFNCGYPRNDLFFKGNSKIETKIRDLYEVEDSTKLVLYAPTYRNGRKTDMYNIDEDVVCKALEKRFGAKFKLMIRLHPSLREKSDQLSFHNAIDVSDYEDMQELLFASDVLISDYSSVITEFALTMRPVFLFAVDIDGYTNERDFYCDYYNLPFSVAATNEELYNNIINYEEKAYIDKVEQCFLEYGIREYGVASEFLSDIIDDFIVSHK